MKKTFTLKKFVSGMENIIPKENDTSYQRIIAVGDVHGCFDRLMSLWEKISATEEDLIIFLGDYVDRGAKVTETLEWVMNQSKMENRIFLRGNHEQMLLDAFTDAGREFIEKFFTGKRKIITYRDILGHEEQISWYQNGGRPTFNALMKLEQEEKISVEEVLNFF